MTLGLTHGELLLVAFIFALVYVAGLLPKIAVRLVGGDETEAGVTPKRQ